MMQTELPQSVKQSDTYACVNNYTKVCTLSVDTLINQLIFLKKSYFRGKYMYHVHMLLMEE